jgi:hypothetical protein
MKKVILSLVFVLATGTSFMNAISSSNEYIESKSGTIEILEEFGCASDCVKESRKKIQDASDVLGEDPNDHIDDYMDEYINCYSTNC